MAWTKAVTLNKTFDLGNGETRYVFAYTVTSDAGNSGDITLSTELTTTYSASESKRIMNLIAGGVVEAVKFEPGAATPTSQGTITLDDETGALFFSEEVAVAGTAEIFAGDVDSSFFVPITELVLACTTLANTKTAIIYVWIKK